MAKRDTSQLKWKKKKWYELRAPAVFNSVSLGEALCEDTEHLVGRVIQANMMNVVRNPRMQSITMRFRVTHVADGVGHTDAYTYTMAPSSVKRLVRSRRDRLDDSFVVMTKDGKAVRIKPIVITTFNTTYGAQRAIRSMTRNEISGICEKKDFSEFIAMVVEGELQKTLKRTVGKLMPIRTVDIRAFEVVENPKHVVTYKEPEPVVSEPVVEESQ